MDEYLSEKEQIEQIRTWWKDNGWYLIGGVAIGLAGLFGYGRYQDYTNAQAEQAEALYAEIVAAVDDDDAELVDSLLGRLREGYAGSPYTDHAGLLVARLFLVRDSARAATELRRVMDTTDDPQLAMVARLRLARVLAYRDDYDAALALLDVGDPGQFAGRIEDIKGDIFLARGDTDMARAAFAAALVAPGSEFVDREFVQLKLSDLLATRPASVTEGAE